MLGRFKNICLLISLFLVRSGLITRQHCKYIAVSKKRRYYNEAMLYIVAIDRFRLFLEGRCLILNGIWIVGIICF